MWAKATKNPLNRARPLDVKPGLAGDGGGRGGPWPYRVMVRLPTGSGREWMMALLGPADEMVSKDKPTKCWHG